MLLIFVEEISERLCFTLDFVFKNRGLEYQLTNDPVTFTNHTLPKLNYSERYFDDVLQLKPATVLFDEEVMIYSIHARQFNHVDCLSFNYVTDPLASIFYVLSRMEEYTSTLEDEHGRYLAKYSVLHRFNWLEQCICDRWAESFLKYLKNHALIKFAKEKYEVQIVPTFDIDNAYAYKLKGGARKVFSMAKDLLRGDRRRLIERQQVLLGTSADPYDTYDYIVSIADRGFQVNMFWLLGDYAKFDKNISFKDARHQRLIRKMDLKTTVGIHPSYKSNSYEYYLLNEKERLEEIVGHPIEHSRQHFLKFKLPSTYYNLMTLGINHEYSMGYAERVGFRAGTARPFYWFDLEHNTQTKMLLHPFVYMDGTLNEYLKLSPEQSMDKIKALYQEIKKYGGDFVCIWHNETIGNYGKWKGWNEVLEYTLELNNKDDEQNDHS